MDIEQQLAGLADADGNVKSEDLMGLLYADHQEGDTGASATETGAPDAGLDNTDPAAAPAAPAAPAPAPAPAAPAPADPAAAAPAAPAAPTPTPVVLAKDGVHTIEYSVLEAARADAARLEVEVARLRALADAPKTTAPAPAPAADPSNAADPDAPAPSPFGDWTDEAVARGVEAIVEKRMAEERARLAPLLQQQEDVRRQSHLQTIMAAHPDASSIVQSTEFAAWRDAQPSFFREGIERMQAEGCDAADFVKLLDQYRAVNPRTAPPAAPAAPAAAPAAPAMSAAEIATRAAKAIEQAQTQTPTSLSDFPAGSQVHNDEAQHVLSLNGPDMLERMSKMTPQAIDAMLDKAG